MLNGYVTALAYAARMEGGEVKACEFYCDGHGGPPGVSAQAAAPLLTTFCYELQHLTSIIAASVYTSRHDGFYGEFQHFLTRITIFT